jgi:hypothetical protein
MNLHGTVRGAITSVNPDKPVQWLASAGSSVAPGGKQTATFAAPVTLQGQIQAAPTSMLKRYNLLSGNEIYRTVYFYGQRQAINRAAQLGGDLLQFPEVPTGTTRTWLIIKVPEQWPDWCCVLCVMQLDPNNPP